MNTPLIKCQNLKYIDKYLLAWQDITIPAELRLMYGRIIITIVTGEDNSFAFWQHKHCIDTGETLEFFRYPTCRLIATTNHERSLATPLS